MSHSRVLRSRKGRQAKDACMHIALTRLLSVGMMFDRDVPFANMVFSVP